MSELMSADLPQNDKIKTPFAIIKISGTKEKPYYGIVYYDPTDRYFHEGFGSYNLNMVRQWLEQEFEIVHEPKVEYVPVVHEKWENDAYGTPRCSGCSYIPEFNRLIDDYYYSDFCPNCGARMERKNDDA